MNAGLTRWQVEDILAASEQADVPAGDMLRAAEDIRAAFLGPAIDSSRRTSEVVSPIRVRRQTRRARTRVAAVCAATLSVAALLGAANAGGLPSAVQRPVARVAGLVGIDLPTPDSADVPPDTDAAVRGARVPGATGTPAATAGSARGTRSAGETSATSGSGSAPQAGGNTNNNGVSDPDNNAGGNPNAGPGNNARGNPDNNGVSDPDNNAGGNPNAGPGNNARGNPDNNAGGTPDNHSVSNPDDNAGGRRFGMPETVPSAPLADRR